MDQRLQRSFKAAGHSMPVQMRRKGLGRRTLPQRIRHLWRDDAYLLIVEGNCMSPVLHHGDYVMFSPSEPLKNGSIAAFYDRGGGDIWVKSIVSMPDEPMVRAALTGPHSEVVPALRLAQFNPGRAGWVGAHKFSAIHGMVCVFRSDEV